MNNNTIKAASRRSAQASRVRLDGTRERTARIPDTGRDTDCRGSGGEQFQAGIGRPPRSLKKQFQAAAVPAWQRDGPLIYSGGQLVFVPGLGIDARVVGLPGQELVSFQWLPLDQGAG